MNNCSLRGIKVARIKPGMSPAEQQLINVKKEIKLLEMSGRVEALSQGDMFQNMVSKKSPVANKAEDFSVVSSDSRYQEGRLERALQAREKR